MAGDVNLFFTIHNDDDDDDGEAGTGDEVGAPPQQPSLAWSRCLSPGPARVRTERKARR